MKISVTRICCLMIAVLAASVQVQAQTTYTGPNGTFNNDRWNTGANWSTGLVPMGVTDVVIEANRKPSINGGITPAYTGNLTLEAGSQIELGISSTATDQDNAFGTGTIFMNAGSRLLMRTPQNTTNDQDIEFLANAEFAIGTSTSSHGRQRTWTGDFSGVGDVGIRTTNRQSLTLSGDNSGLMGTMYIGDNDGAGFGDNLSENNRAALVAGSAEGLPDLLQVGNGVNLRVNVANTIEDLNIFGNYSDQQGGFKLFLNGVDLTVTSATLNGVALSDGTYGAGDGFIALDNGGNNPKDFFGGTGMLIVDSGGGGPTPLAGDFNGDGTVDAADYTLYVDNLGQADESAFAPGTGDGMNGVDSADYDLWRTSFGNTAPPLLGGGGGAVPEPSTIALLAGGLGLIALRNRRK